MPHTAEEPINLLREIAESSKAYYQLLYEGPQPEHFSLFLDSLPEGLRSYFQQKGFQASRSSIVFRRFVLEKAGQRMDAFLQQRLNADAYKCWQEQDQFQAELLHKLRNTA